MKAEHLDELESNIKIVIDDILKEKRQYINKHMQNSLNNYFLENYCVLSLKQRFGIQSGRQIKNSIIDKYQFMLTFENVGLSFSSEQQNSLKKYYFLLLGFLEEHLANGTIASYRSTMLNLLNEVTPQRGDHDILDKAWSVLQWKKLLALFVLHHSYFPEIEAIYQIWFDIFQNRIIDERSQKKKKPDNIRLYKYFGLPYVLNNEFYKEKNQKQITLLEKGTHNMLSTPDLKLLFQPKIKQDSRFKHQLSPKLQDEEQQQYIIEKYTPKKLKTADYSLKQQHEKNKSQSTKEQQKHSFYDTSIKQQMESRLHYHQQDEIKNVSSTNCFFRQSSSAFHKFKPFKQDSGDFKSDPNVQNISTQELRQELNPGSSHRINDCDSYLPNLKFEEDKDLLQLNQQYLQNIPNDNQMEYVDSTIQQSQQLQMLLNNQQQFQQMHQNINIPPTMMPSQMPMMTGYSIVHMPMICSNEYIQRMQPTLQPQGANSYSTPALPMISSYPYRHL